VVLRLRYGAYKCPTTLLLCPVKLCVGSTVRP